MYNVKCLFLVFSFTHILLNAWQVRAQENPDSGKMYFISDCQQPLKIEKLRLKPYRNEEARDSLFSDLTLQHPRNVFFLGDMTSSGSNNLSWKPMDHLLNVLYRQKSSIHAIPGNHEYYRNSRRGLNNYKKRFSQCPLYGYCVQNDSVAVVMLNSNFSKMGRSDFQKQQTWYHHTMDSLNADKATRFILVCAHHAPYSNSKIVGSSKAAIRYFMPRFMDSPKSRIFISGHSHNLEYFNMGENKHFLVIGGGGGLTQPLIAPEKSLYTDLLRNAQKPLYFYLVVERQKNSLMLIARGLQSNFTSVEEFPIGRIE